MGGRVNIMNYYLPQRHITKKYDISTTKVHICLNVSTLTKVNCCQKEVHFICGILYKKSMGVALIS